MINALVAKAQHVPEEGWTMQDGTPWLGNNVRDHSGIIQVGKHKIIIYILHLSLNHVFVLCLTILHQNISLKLQVFLGQSGGRDIEGNELPSLVYVSREKRPGSNHHKKAGAMNALV